MLKVMEASSVVVSFAPDSPKSFSCALDTQTKGHPWIEFVPVGNESARFDEELAIKSWRIFWLKLEGSTELGRRLPGRPPKSPPITVPTPGAKDPAVVPRMDNTSVADIGS